MATGNHMTRLTTTLAALACAALATVRGTDTPVSPGAAAPLDMLLAVVDLAGQTQRPFAGKEQRATVLFFVAHDCPVSNKFAPELRRIADEFALKGVRCALVYADPDLSAADIRQHVKEFALSVPTLAVYPDRAHALTRAAGATHTPEAVVVTATGHIAYRGRINNLYEELGSPRAVVTQHDLRVALAAVLAGKVPNPKWPAAIGCFISPLPSPSPSSKL